MILIVIHDIDSNVKISLFLKLPKNRREGIFLVKRNIIFSSVFFPLQENTPRRFFFSQRVSPERTVSEEHSEGGGSGRDGEGLNAYSSLLIDPDGFVPPRGVDGRLLRPSVRGLRKKMGGQSSQ